MLLELVALVLAALALELALLLALETLLLIELLRLLSLLLTELEMEEAAVPVTELRADEREDWAEVVADEREDANEEAPEETEEAAPVSVERAPPAPEVAVVKAPPASEVSVSRMPPWHCLEFSFEFFIGDMGRVGRTYGDGGGDGQVDDVLDLHDCGVECLNGGEWSVD